MSIRLEHVNYIYDDNSDQKNAALQDVNLEIQKGGLSELSDIRFGKSH
jgi:ABC-type methionine transport system ATPase subunit